MQTGLKLLFSEIESTIISSSNILRRYSDDLPNVCKVLNAVAPCRTVAIEIAPLCKVVIPTCTER